VIKVKLTIEEINNKQLNPDTLKSAVEQVRLNGYVLLEGVLDPDLVERMNTSFHQALEGAMKNSPGATEINMNAFRKNRVRMDLPFDQPFIDPEVITSPFVLPIIDKLIGEDCACIYLSADAPLPGSDYQVVHSDQQALFPDAAITLPPYALVLNIPLVDVTEENGPMDAWPGGTHLIPENRNKSEFIQAGAEFLKPVSMMMPKGSLLIRDLRMWHRGTPNNSDSVRPNVAVIYAKPWLRSEYQATLGIRREKFEGLSERAKQIFRYETIND
jgi:ectoine hydroxylase-related dioxygenase (phytanoyl-CoA dioxygenase family)